MKYYGSEEYHEMAFYTLAHPDMEYFIHQHVVDAFQAQTADENTKPIAIIFSLAGLYLFAEKGYTGRMVQQAHIRMSQNKIPWPSVELPPYRGDITISDVLKTAPGAARDEMIKKWVMSAWEAFRPSHQIIMSTVRTTAGI
jgi:hypothetical protein